MAPNRRALCALHATYIPRDCLLANPSMDRPSEATLPPHSSELCTCHENCTCLGQERGPRLHRSRSVPSYLRAHSLRPCHARECLSRASSPWIPAPSSWATLHTPVSATVPPSPSVSDDPWLRRMPESLLGAPSCVAESTRAILKHVFQTTPLLSVRLRAY
jgi:hypothetical protein